MKVQARFPLSYLAKFASLMGAGLVCALHPAQAQTLPLNAMPPAKPLLAQSSLAVPSLAEPRIGQHTNPDHTRVVLDLPDGARYTIIPTFAGVRIDLQGVQARSKTVERLSPQLSQWQYIPVVGGVVVTLGTPFPLSLDAGWRAEEIPPRDGMGRRLVIDLGSGLSGGGLGRAAEAVSITPFVAPRAARAQIQESVPVQSGSPLIDTPQKDQEVPPAPNEGTATVPRIQTPVTTVPPIEGRAEVRQPERGAIPVITGPAPSGILGALIEPRWGINAGFTRLVLDLPAGAVASAQVSGGNLLIAVQGVQTARWQGERVSAEVSGWQVAPAITGLGAVANVRTPFALTANSGWRAQSLPPAPGQDRPRLVVDFSPAFANVTPLTAEERRIRPFPAGTVIVLDPGHGGSDPGAVVGVIEKNVVLDVGLRLRDILTAAGARVVMSRTTDTELHRNKATDLAMRGRLGTPDVAALVSIHSNSIYPEAALRAYGIETFWMNNHPRSSALANQLQTHMVGMTNNFSRRVSQRTLGVLRASSAPAALIEIGFGSHPVDGLNLADTHYLDRIAYGVARGLREFVGN